MSDFATFLISLTVGALWISLISPLLCGWFGAPLPLGFRERRIAMRKWSIKRYLWLWGVLTMGGAMFLGTGLNDYFAWQHWPYPWPRPALAARVLLHAAEWLAFGATYGWLTWDEEKHRQTLR